MVSLLRMKFDLWMQSILVSGIFLALLLETRVFLLQSMLIILLLFQMLSAAQLWFWHSYRKAKVYLCLFLTMAIFLPFGLHYFNPQVWLFLVLLGLTYFLHTINIAAIVWRRPRSFWDIS